MEISTFQKLLNTNGVKQVFLADSTISVVLTNEPHTPGELELSMQYTLGGEPAENTEAVVPFKFSSSYTTLIIYQNEVVQLIPILRENIFYDNVSLSHNLDLTGDGTNELIVHWEKSYHFDGDMSTGNSTTSGLAIFDLKNDQQIFSGKTLSQSYGSSMCEGWEVNYSHAQWEVSLTSDEINIVKKSSINGKNDIPARANFTFDTEKQRFTKSNQK